jgi:hypothetical protein
MKRLAVGFIVLAGVAVLHFLPILVLPILAYLIGTLFESQNRR